MKKTQPDWIANARSAWKDALQDPLKTDAAIERLIHTTIQEARSSREKRLEMLSQVRAHRRLRDGFTPVLTMLAEASAAWCSGEYRRTAEVLRAQGEPTAKTSDAERALRIHALTWRAACETRLRNLFEACSLLDDAEDLLGDDPWTNCRGWLHAERGRLAFWQDRVAHSCEQYARAVECFQASRNRFALANICEGLARIRIHEGRYNDARGDLDRADVWREQQDRLGRVKRFYHRGRISRYQRNWNEAILELEAARELVVEIGDARWEAHIRDVLGDVYLLRGETGDLNLAQREFSHPVFAAGDPVIASGKKYRDAKLMLERARRETHRKKRRLAIEAVIRLCDELGEEQESLMIPEKALRLKGTALAELEDFSEAADCFETAASSFARRRANWYVSDCLCKAGGYRLSAGQLAESAQNFLNAVRSAVDDLQRDEAITALRTHFQRMSADRVCSLLVELLNDRNRLQDECDAVRMQMAAFQETMRSVTCHMEMLGGLRHLRQIAGLIDSGRTDDAKQEIEGIHARMSRVMEVAREAARSAAPGSTAWSWCAAAALCHRLPPLVDRCTPADDLEHWGLHGPLEQLQESLVVLAQFALSRGTLRLAQIRFDSEASHLRIHVELGGAGVPNIFSLFNGFPQPGELKDWGLDVAGWARLLDCVRHVRGVGGVVRFERLASKARAKAQYFYQLTVDIPVAARPAAPDFRATVTVEQP